MPSFGLHFSSLMGRMEEISEQIELRSSKTFPWNLLPATNKPKLEKLSHEGPF